MKKTGLNYLLLALVFYLGFSQGFSQCSPSNFSVALRTATAHKNTLPFWMYSNSYGAAPNSEFASVYGAMFSDFKETDSDFKFSYKASFTGYVASENDLFIQELYGSIGYRNWQLDLGAKNDELIWEGLSSSNGNIIKSSKTRAFPGFNLKTRDYLKVPFSLKWLRVKANYAEYLLNDKRIADGAHLHHKSLYFKSVLSEKISMITGMDHYVQWGGHSDEFGNLPSGMSDYLRVITGSAGGLNSEISEQNNALGNHVSSYLFQVTYTGDKTNYNVYWSHPFEDRPGLELANFPDALYGLFIDLKKPNGFITHILGEFYYTKHQGRSDSRPDFSENYFNGSIYYSGWTYFGNVIGAPFFRPKIPVNGITEGIDLNYSRFTAYHLGFKGCLNETIKYKTYVSYVYYPGWFDDALNKEQFSSLVEIYLQPKKMPFEITCGTAVDFGSALPKNIGGFLQLRFPMND